MAEIINGNRLQRQAETLGIALTPEMLERLDLYARMLVEWNQRMNLTTIVEPEEIETKHFLDCLFLAAQPEVAGALADIGSGAGFPGMVAAIYRPDIALTVVEPNGKRLAFLQALSSELGLQVELLKERAEEAARKGWRQRYDVATARAVAPLNMLCEYCLPLVRPGGVFVAMKADAGAELEAAARAMERLGAGEAQLRDYQLPGQGTRSLVVIHKTAPTPPQYPRAGGVIKKRPL